MLLSLLSSCLFFFFNDTATTEIYTLSLHDAFRSRWAARRTLRPTRPTRHAREPFRALRSEEHTSELQSQFHLVCRLLLEKKTMMEAYDVRAGADSNVKSLGANCLEVDLGGIETQDAGVYFFLIYPAPPEISPLPLPNPFPI